jgi:hypothetical protein
MHARPTGEVGCEVDSTSGSGKGGGVDGSSGGGIGDGMEETAVVAAMPAEAMAVEAMAATPVAAAAAATAAASAEAAAPLPHMLHCLVCCTGRLGQERLRSMQPVEQALKYDAYHKYETSTTSTRVAPGRGRARGSARRRA